MNPLVSVICLSYNHQDYIKEALDSVVNQTFTDLEIIIVDDASTDSSAQVIEEYIKAYPQIQFISLKENVGNCKAFNLGYKLSKGDYLFDFALDDVLLPTRLARQVAAFQKLDDRYGVVFSDVLFINEKSESIGAQYNRDATGKIIEDAPKGDVYKDLLERYCICPTSMLSKRKVFEEINGYDETLAYEDFDFWVRTSRVFQYHFIDEILTLKRRLPNSHGSKFRSKNQEQMLVSTLKVCEKAFFLNRNREENKALATRIRFHLRQALFTEHFEVCKLFYALLSKATEITFMDKIIRLAASLRLPLYWVYGKLR